MSLATCFIQKIGMDSLAVHCWHLFQLDTSVVVSFFVLSPANYDGR